VRQVLQEGKTLTVKTTRVVEYGDDQVSSETMLLDGSESHSDFMDSPRVATAVVSPDGDRIVVPSTVILTWGQPGAKIVSKDTWELVD
jgi:hypothetical protein